MLRFLWQIGKVTIQTSLAKAGEAKKGRARIDCVTDVSYPVTAAERAAVGPFA